MRRGSMCFTFATAPGGSSRRPVSRRRCRGCRVLIHVAQLLHSGRNAGLLCTDLGGHVSGAFELPARTAGQPIAPAPGRHVPSAPSGKCWGENQSLKLWVNVLAEPSVYRTVTVCAV